MSGSDGVPEGAGAKPVPPLVPQAHGGAIYRGGLPGNPSNAAPTHGALKRKARRILDKWLSSAEAEADDKADPRGDTLRLLTQIAGPTKAEDSAPDEDAPSAPTIRVLTAPDEETTPPPSPSPPKSEKQRRVPSADPSLPGAATISGLGQAGEAKGPPEGGEVVRPGFE